MDIIKVFGSNVRKYRTEKGISQEKFAELCGLHRTYISDIECFRRSISLDNIQSTTKRPAMVVRRACSSRPARERSWFRIATTIPTPAILKIKSTFNSIPPKVAVLLCQFQPKNLCSDKAWLEFLNFGLPHLYKTQEDFLHIGCSFSDFPYRLNLIDTIVIIKLLCPRLLEINLF